VSDLAVFEEAIRRVGAGGTVLDPSVVTRTVGRRRRDNGRSTVVAAASVRRRRAAREHEPGGQPLAHRRARHADPADRGAGRLPGATADERPAQHRARDGRARDRPYVVVGRDGAPLPVGAERSIEQLAGVRNATA
jgi:hypothetical protein